MSASNLLLRLVSPLLFAVSVAPGGAAQAPERAEPCHLLWQIGLPDGRNAELALAPADYPKYRDDGFFVVGRSEAARDWPYVHPGPHDQWAGGRSHTFRVVFGVKEAVAAGTCTLRVALLDTQSRTPPQLRIEVNGNRFDRQMPAGAGDASVSGEPEKGKPHRFAIEFPAARLRQGANEISLTTVSGSWVLYDSLALEAPAAMQAAEVSGTVVAGVDSPAVLVEREGKLMQLVRFTVRHFGEPAPAGIRVGDSPETPVSLAAGVQQFEVPVPAVAKETTLEVSLAAGGKPLATRGVTLRPVRKWVVYLLPHSHVDIGYTHVQTEVERAQWKYLEMAIDAARKSAGNPPGSRFKWNVEVLWAVDGYLKQASPEKQREFFEAVKAGQVGLQALYGNELTGLCRPEELLRLLGFAQRLGARAGVPVESAMITDVPGYTWGIVPAMAHSGVKYFSIGPNGGDRIGHTAAAWGDKPFWWVGPNGSDKVLVWMTGTGYYRVFSSPENLMRYLDQLAAKGYPYDFVQVRHCLGDNGAPDVGFADTVKRWNETHAYPKLVIATTDEMFRDFERRYGSEIPVARGDFTPYWEDGAASSALETALNRASVDRLTQAETLFAMDNPRAYPAAAFRQAWRDVILYDEHTWGAHNSISQPDAPFVKSQWAIKRQFAVDADSRSRQLLAAADESRGSAPELPPGVQALDVVNTTARNCPWGLVVVPKELSQAGDCIKREPAGDASHPTQRLSTGELVFRPCCGAYASSRFYLTGDPPAGFADGFPAARAEGNTLRAEGSAVAGPLALRIDETTGAIASLKYRDRELVDPRAATALNDYFYLPGSDLQGLRRNGAVRISVKEKGPLVASLLVESDAPGCRRLAREYRLHALRNYVEVINTLDKAPVRAKEGVHFGFGFQVPGGTVRMDVPWAVVRPEQDQIPGACKNWFTVQRYVDVSNDDYGVTWLTPDAPLVEIGGITANLIGSLSDPRAWKDKLEPSQTLYSWAMNNHWHTNYRAEQEGPTEFRYVIWPHDGRDRGEPAHFALEYSQPLLALPARGAASPELPLRGLPSGVQVTAFKPSEDGKAWILRLYGVTDRALKARLPAWRAPAPTQVSLSDNSELPLRPAPAEIEIPPHGIVTLRAEFPTPGHQVGQR